MWACRGAACCAPSRSVPAGLSGGRTLSAFLLLAGLAAAARAQTPAGTVITAQAQVTYEDSAGVTYSASSALVTVTVAQVAGVDVEAPRSAVAGPGTNVVFAHTLANVGNGPDTITVSASSAAGWPVTVRRDADANGALDPGDPALVGAVPLAMGDTAHLLLVVSVPPGPGARGTSDTITLSAQSGYDPAVTDALQDLIDVPDAGIVVGLTKAVDRASATTGDIVTYTVGYSAAGAGTASEFEIRDAVPFGAVYVPGTLRLNGAPLSDAPGDDAGSFDATGPRVVVRIDTIGGSDAGTVVFQVTPAGLGAPATLTNTAAATYRTSVGVDSIASNAVQTALVLADVAVEKQLASPAVAGIGDSVAYTIRYRNSSTSAAARDLVVSDTLPAGLDFVAAQPAPTVSGRTLTWAVGDLAPGDSAEITLTTRVAASVQDTLQATNVAFLAALNAPATAAAAAPVDLIGATGALLALELAADLLEVGLGETAPFTAIVENTGTVAVADLRLEVSLAAGARYARGSALGADSVRTAGDTLTLFVPGSLAPGGRVTVRFATAIVSAEGEIVSHRAQATGEAGSVRSPEAVAWVRVRHAWPMETRAAIGKVYADANLNGKQDSGEPGVEGVDVWTDDGEVATTDADGKFSFRNLRPGRHGFRLDATTLPATFRLPDAVDADLVVLDAGGWTTPRVSFRVVPTGAAVDAVLLPVPWRLTARPIHRPAGATPAPAAAPAERRTLSRFQTNRTQPILAFESRMLQIELPRLLAQRPECYVEITGHADYRPVLGGPYRDNLELSIARAESVSVYLRRLGVSERQIRIEGAGETRPLTSARDEQALRWNRRGEVQLVCGGASSPTTPPDRVEYEVVVENPYDVPLSDLALRFAPAADSAVITRGEAVLARLFGPRAALPLIAPRSRLVVRAWAARSSDSATALIEGGPHAPDRLIAEVHNPLRPVVGVTTARARAAALPTAALVPAGDAIEIALRPAPAGWPHVVYALPAGWELVSGSTRLGAVPARDPAVRRDRSGQRVLAWQFTARQPAVLSFALHPERSAESEPVRLAALRSAANRTAEARRGLVAGPGVAFLAPVDGTVHPSDRLYVGVRGEPAAPVTLFDGDSVIAEATLRIDGVHDFIAVALTRGPHRLRVRMMNSWRQERWDSLAVHVAGLPARFETPARPIALTADGHSVEALRVRLLDRWGVPLVTPTHVTVVASGAEPVGPDTDRSSVGVQVRTDGAGWVSVILKPGRDVGQGRVELRAGDARAEIPLELLPALRPLMLTGVGRFGIGASADAFGSLTARGRLDRRTGIVLSYDSRRLDAGRDALGRAFDPLDEAQYPILGDASRVRTLTASRAAFAAKIERGFDWVGLGDLSTTELGAGLQLTRYQRALTGGAARITTGPVVWQGFGSLTRQGLRQTQLRGVGASGPYTLQSDIVPGTEQIVIETRARENAQRIVTRQGLVRFVDYEIDYARGTVLFKRPVPAADAYENPVFIVVTYESAGVGEQRWVGGLRAAVDARGVAGRALDSLRVGATAIRADEVGGAHYLAGADLRVLRAGGLDVRAEVSYAETSDSSGAAGVVDGAVHLFGGAVALHGAWMRVGAGYANPSNTALRAGTEEVRVGGALTLGPSSVRVEHERQDFGAGLGRERTRAAIIQSVGRHLQLEAGHTTDQFQSGSTPDHSQAGEVAVRWMPRPGLKLWAEGRQQLEQSQTVVRPDHVGAGAAFQVSRFVTLEAGHRQMLVDGAGAYAVTSLGARATVWSGTQAWSSYQLVGGASGPHNAAVVGLSNRLELGAAWRVNASFERRVGLDAVALTDPVRALPFAQAEEDYWAAGLGVELLPPDAPYRLSLRGEYRDGASISTRLAGVAGEISVSRSLAVLSRQEYLVSEQLQPTGPVPSRRLASLWGVALRPVGTDAVNILTKFSWLDESNPVGGGVLTPQGDVQRLIGAAELIWAPTARTELAGRYAVRRSRADQSLATGGPRRLTSWAEYVGGRAELNVAPWLAVRGESRLLVEHESGAHRWDAAPALVVKPLAALEVAGGYRVGDLRDPDFAVRGGHGWFVTVGARLTERALTSAADFWRPRFGSAP